MVVRDPLPDVCVSSAANVTSPSHTHPLFPSASSFSPHDAYPPLCARTGLLADPAGAPPSFCSRAPRGIFSQYALEPLLLRRWYSLSSSSSSTTTSPHSSSSSTLILHVVPSLYYHCRLRDDRLTSHSLVARRWFNPFFLNLSSSSSSSVFSDLFSLSAWREYWRSIAASLPPSAFCVVAFGFAWDLPVHHHALTSLGEMPASFTSRIAIVSIEGPMRPVVVSAAAGALPPPPPPLGTLLLSVPYPTSVVRPVRWSSSERTRPIAVLTTGRLRRRRIRKLVDEELRALEDSFAVVRVKDIFSAVCVEGEEASCTARSGVSISGEGGGGDDDDDGSVDLLDPLSNVWNLATSAVFCVEPGGDTPTRSHLYVAILCGCIPVIFDADEAHNGYPAGDTVRWAWRRGGTEEEDGGSSSSPPSLDYRRFAVVLNATRVYERRTAVVRALIDFPRERPRRLREMRQALDAAAEWMYYARGGGEDRDGEEAGEAVTTDAFSRMRERLVWWMTEGQTRRKEHVVAGGSAAERGGRGGDAP